MTALLKIKIVQEGDEVTKLSKEATLVITGKSSVKDEEEKLFGSTKSFLKKFPNQTIGCRVLYHHWISDCLKNGKLMSMDEHNSPLVSKLLFQILLQFKRTNLQSNDFVNCSKF